MDNNSSIIDQRESSESPDILKTAKNRESLSSQQPLTKLEQIEQNLEKVNNQLEKLTSRRKPRNMTILEFNSYTIEKTKELEKEKIKLEREKDAEVFNIKLAEFYEEMKRMADELPRYPEEETSSEYLSDDEVSEENTSHDEESSEEGTPCGESDPPEEELSDDISSLMSDSEYAAKEEVIAFGERAFPKFPWQKFTGKLRNVETSSGRRNIATQTQREFFCHLGRAISKRAFQIINNVDILGKSSDDQWETYRGECDTDDSGIDNLPSGYPDESNSVNALFRIKELAQRYLAKDEIECIDVPWTQKDRYDLAYKGCLACLKLLNKFWEVIVLIKQNRNDLANAQGDR